MPYISPSITASDTTFAQFQVGGASTLLEKLIAANLNGTQSPSVAPTVLVSGSGGLLAAGTYHLLITETNGLGETTTSPESVPFTVTAGQIPTVTFPPLQTGNTARNVYLNPENGDRVFLYAAGIVAEVFNLSADSPPATASRVGPPSANSTGLTSTKLQLIRYLKTGQLEKLWEFLTQLLSGFSRGDQGTAQSVTGKLRDIHTVFAILSQLCAEAGDLIVDNPVQPGDFRDS